MKDPDHPKDFAPLMNFIEGGDIDLVDVAIDEDYKQYLYKYCVFGDVRTVPCSMKESENAVDCDAEKVEVVDDDDDEDDDYDPDYKIFCQNLKPCGSAYVLEIAKRSGNVIVEYEKNDEDERRRKRPYRVRGNTPKPQKPLRRKKTKYVSSSKEPAPTPKVVDVPCQKGEQEARKPVTRNETKFASSSKGPAPKVESHVEIDSGYSYFLARVKLVRGCPVFSDEDGKDWIYEEFVDEGPDSDTDGFARTQACSARMTPESSNLNRSIQEAPQNQRVVVEDSSTQFRDGVMAILQKPYNPKEHRDLLKAAKLRKPVCHYKEVRGRSIPFPDEDNLGKSYLDSYKELKRKVKAAQQDDPRKTLNLLRGLFFYLKHVCWQDSFVPWNDKSWLEALDKCTSK